MSTPTRTVFLSLLCVWFCLSTPGSARALEILPKSDLAPPQAEFGGVFRRMLGDTPSTLDPALLADIYGRSVVSQVFDGLVQFDAHLNPTPAIAEFWEASPDGLTWTFHLRRGVKFHHGREVTAEDVRYSFSRLLEGGRRLPTTVLFHRIRGATAFMAGKAPTVEGLRVLDRYTLQMALEEPFASSLAVLGLTNAAVVPREEVERLGDAFGRMPVGTGPFKFVHWKPNHEIVLEAHQEYFEGRPFLDRVVFKIGVGTKLEERFQAFLQGQVEEAIVPSEKTDDVHLDPRFSMYQRIRKPTLSLVYIGFNTQMKPFDDRRVRQAFNYAVDREAIVRNITRRDSLTAVGILPPGMPGHDADLQGYAYEPERARQLLAEAGYPNGLEFPVVQLWSVFKAKSTRAELAAYQQYLAAQGVNVDIHYAPDWPTYREMLEQGKMPMFLLSWFADFPDPQNFLAPLLHSKSTTNRTFYHNAVVDQLLEQAERELGYTQRIALYRQIERIAVQDAPWISHYHPVFEYLYQPYVRGVEVSLLGERAIPLKKVWLQKSLMESSSRVETDDQLPP